MSQNAGVKRWTRGIVTAGIGFTAATMMTGAAISTDPETKSGSYQTVWSAGLISAVIGGICGLLAPVPASAPSSTRTTTKNSTQSSAASTHAAQLASASEKAAPGWRDWRRFVVVRKARESNEISSFYLEPEDGGTLPSFLPGQFLTLKLDIPDQPRPVIRTYSLSDYQPNAEGPPNTEGQTNTEGQSYYRLSIKRESSPKGVNVPPGVGSTFMHDRVYQGTTLLIKPPNGKFFLEPKKMTPVVLISNGVGITPMISMAKAIASTNPQRHVWFLHGARHGAFHAFRNEINTLAQGWSNLHVYYRYSRPRPDDEGHYHSQGYVDDAMVKTIVLPDIEQACGTAAAAEYFLCGSPAFMDSLRAGLKELAVPETQVFFESFTKPKAAPKASVPAGGRESDGAIATHEGPGKTITFAKSGKTATWHPGDGILLDFAEAQGIDAAYSCRSGICLTCMCRVEAGEVEYEEDPTGSPDEGTALICVAKPKTDQVVLDL